MNALFMFFSGVCMEHADLGGELKFKVRAEHQVGSSSSDEV